MAEYYLLDIYLKRLSNTALTGFDSLIIARNLKITSTSYHAQNLPSDSGKYLYNVRAANAHGVSTYNTCGGCFCMHTNGIYLLNNRNSGIIDTNFSRQLRVDAISFHQTPLPVANADSSYFYFPNFAADILFQSQVVDTVWGSIENDRTSGLSCLREPNNSYPPSYSFIAHTTNKEKFRQFFRSQLEQRYATSLTRSFTPSDLLFYRYTFANTTTSTPMPPEAMLQTASIMPNPASDVSTVTLFLPTPSSVRLTLHDALGREVRTIADGIYPAGQQEFSASLGGLPSGIYFVRGNIGGQVVVRRLAVVR
jgi:hypothetical protein